MKKLISSLIVAFSIIPCMAQTTHTFTSVDVFDVDGKPGIEKRVTVSGVLSLPKGDGPFPAVVISNSSAGTGDKVSERLLQDLPKYGYAVFAIQSFSGRGIEGGVGQNQTSVSFQGPAVDALYALEFLRSRPEIDSNRICAAGHSRGGASSFTFSYFKSFIETAKFKGKPFDCNISINHSGFIRPQDERTTNKPALVLVGEKDNVWYLKENVEWINSLINKGDNIKLVVIKDSYHALVSTREWCPKSQVSKCREPVLYNNEGSTLNNQLVNSKQFTQQCMGYGYYCGYGTMDKYPVALNEIVSFLNQNIGQQTKIVSSN